MNRVGALQSGLAGPMDPILAALVGFNTFEEANEGITSIYKVLALPLICAAVKSHAWGGLLVTVRASQRCMLAKFDKS